MTRLFAWALFFAAATLPLAAGEADGPIPQAELRALDSAISRELNSGHLGSQTLGDLTRLKNRLQKMRTAAATAPAPAPGGGEDSLRGQLERLEGEARAGGRAARRSLALYYIFLNEPERALAQWREMGRSSDYDTAHFLIASYLELALGEYNSAQRNLETAMRLMDSRTSLTLSTPVFCQTIGGYRIYAERPQGSLLPGEETLVYVEVEGAEFAAAPGGGSECDLMFGLKLRNDAQHTLWTESNYGRYAPIFAGPIRDLHAALTWRVPNDLEPGRYHLHVEAIEETTKRRGESVLSFTVGKRDTNPEKRPGGGFVPGLQETLREAGRAFPGTPTPSLPYDTTRPGSGFGSESRDQQQFELLQRYYQNRKVE